MSSNTLADRPQATSTQYAPSHEAVSSAPASLRDDPAAWERLLLAEDDLADAPPIPLDMMRRESLYGDYRERGVGNPLARRSVLADDTETYGGRRIGETG